jgi:AcrR family transcriptional regulator
MARAAKQQDREMVVSPFRTASEREAEKITKREALLLAAVRMFNTRGFTATSLEDVAESLGVTKPVLYYYLGNKDQILQECVRRGTDQLQYASKVASEHDATGLERLQAYLRRYEEIIVSDFGRCVIRTNETEMSAEGAKKFRELKRKIDTTLRELISAGIADSTIAATDVRLTAFLLAGALNWAANWFSHAGPMSPEESAAAMVEALSNGLRPRSTEPAARRPRKAAARTKAIKR